MKEIRTEEKPFTTRIDPQLRMEVRAVALRHGMTMKETIIKLFRLFIKADGVENLERSYNANLEQ